MNFSQIFKAMVKKSPTSSQVHVPSTGEERKVGKEHKASTLENLGRAFADFLREEYAEKATTKAARRVATIAVKNGAKLLMGKRRDNEKWTCPGGHVDDGESMLEGAVRELFEETGIRVDPEDLVELTELTKVADDLEVQSFGYDIENRPKTSMKNDPDGEVYRWGWIDVSDGLPDEQLKAMHVPVERNILMKAIGLVGKAAPTDPGEDEELPDPDANPAMYPGIDDSDVEVLKDDHMGHLQALIDGMDYERNVNLLPDDDLAKEMAIHNLRADPDHYRRARMGDEWTDDVLSKGHDVDLGSGIEREDGHIGFDLYPYDYGTVIHDLNLGIPMPDQSCRQVRMVNSFKEMQEGGLNPKALLSEIQRVLMPGGQFHYVGPNDITNQQWGADYPGLVLTDHESKNVEKAEIYKQTFTRLAHPDPATANDAEPRIGIAQFDSLPAEHLLAMDALGYYWSDATTSSRGNRLHGYPSQGALTEPDPKPGVRGEARKVSLKSAIFKADAEKQIVYGVVLAPDEVDSQDDFMTAEEIEKTAHLYMINSRVVGGQHSKAVKAFPVESYIAPIDMDFKGQYGPQTVKKGSWVLGVKIADVKEWEKVKSGDYTGFSVGGLGQRMVV